MEEKSCFSNQKRLACYRLCCAVLVTVSFCTTGIAQSTSGGTTERPGESRNSTPDPYFLGKTRVQKQPAAPEEKPKPSSTTSTPGWDAPLTPVPGAKPPIERMAERTSGLKLDSQAPSINPLLTPQSPNTIIRQNSESDRFSAPPSKDLLAPKSNASSSSSGFQLKLDGPSDKSGATPPLPKLNLSEPASNPQSQPDKAAEMQAQPLQDLEAKPVEFKPGQVLAIVGGDPIFVGDMMFEINQLIEQHMPQAPRSAKEAQIQQLIPAMLPKFVEAKILYKGTVQRLPQELQDNIDKIIEQAGEEFDNKALPEMMESAGVKSTTEFDAQLRGQNSSLRQLRRSWSIEQLTKHFVARELSKTNEPTHQEMLKQYQDNLDSYKIPAKANWEQVMVRFDKCKSRQEARERIAEMGNRIVGGANLAAIAKSSSDGLKAAEGGQRGWISKGALVFKELDRALFTLPLGKLSDVIETEQGYHIVRVIERNDETRTSFLDAQVEIKKKIIEQRRVEAFKQYVAELKKEIPVEYVQ